MGDTAHQGLSNKCEVIPEFKVATIFGTVNCHKNWPLRQFFLKISRNVFESGFSHGSVELQEMTVIFGPAQSTEITRLAIYARLT